MVRTYLQGATVKLETLADQKIVLCILLYKMKLVPLNSSFFLFSFAFYAELITVGHPLTPPMVCSIKAIYVVSLLSHDFRKSQKLLLNSKAKRIIERRERERKNFYH